VQKYLNTARKYGPDQIIETAEEDFDLTDEEYTDLWNRMQRWNKTHKWEKGKWVKRDAPKPVICEGCGEQIPVEQMNVGGRKRRFHDNNNKCKQLAYRNRRKAERERAAQARRERLANRAKA
jgi:hypothetical protein